MREQLTPGASISPIRLSTADSQPFSCNSLSFTLLSKNASANHLVSHSCKNKGLKVPCFHTLTKKGVGEGGLFASEHESPITNHESPAKSSNCFRITYICKFASANPYGSHTSKTKDLKPFRITYLQKKGRVAGGSSSTGFSLCRYAALPVTCATARYGTFLAAR